MYPHPTIVLGTQEHSPENAPVGEGAVVSRVHSTIRCCALVLWAAEVRTPAAWRGSGSRQGGPCLVFNNAILVY
jgi:hypothetical protein